MLALHFVNETETSLIIPNVTGLKTSGEIPRPGEFPWGGVVTAVPTVRYLD
jgi:hypothetical protein